MKSAMIHSAPAGILAARSAYPAAVMAAGAAAMTPTSATMARGAGQVKVCFMPLYVIEAPYAEYPSTEAAVAAHMYWRLLWYDESLQRSFIVPEPTATAIASVAARRASSISI